MKHHHKLLQRFGCPGQSVAEYLLAGSLIVVVAVGGLMALSGSLSDLLASLHQDLGGSGGASSKFPPGQGPGTLSIQPADSSLNKANLTLTTKKGTNIYIQDYLLDPKKTITTLGANGTTDLLASIIEKLAKDLLDAGEITKTQANLLYALANKIHEMAAMERIAEQAIAQNPDDFSPLTGKPITYNGKQFEDLGDMVAEFGLSPYNTIKYGLPPVPGDGWTSSNGHVLQEVLDLYNAAKASGALADSLVEKLVGSTVSEVYWTADALESSVAAASVGWYPPRDTTGWMLTIYEQNGSNPIITETSTLHNFDAGQICAAGGGSSGGVYCHSSSTTTVNTGATQEAPAPTAP